MAGARIEYVDADDAAGPVRGPARPKRTAAAVGLMVALGAGAVVLRAVSSNPSAPPVEPHATGRTVPVLTAHRDSAPEPAPPCPRAGDGRSTCTTTRTLPTEVIAAVHGAVPSARLVAASTQIVRGTHRVWVRTMRFATGGAYRIRIVVEPSRVQPGATGDLTLGQGWIVRAAHHTQGVLVVAEVVVPDSRQMAPLAGPGLEHVAATLAADARLTGV